MGADRWRQCEIEPRIPSERYRAAVRRLAILDLMRRTGKAVYTTAEVWRMLYTYRPGSAGKSSFGHYPDRPAVVRTRRDLRRLEKEGCVSEEHRDRGIVRWRCVTTRWPSWKEVY